MSGNGVRVMLAGDRNWVESARPGLFNSALYADADTGTFFGWIRFDAMASTGMHKHLGPAFSYIVEGALTDFQGEVVAGQMGINLSPATHEAIAYRPTCFVARLEAPVLYMPDATGGSEALHTGALTGPIVADRPEELPDVNITVADLPMVPTSFAGIGRRLVFDYRGLPKAGRCVQLQMLPGTALPLFKTSEQLDLFILGGAAMAGNTHLPTGSLANVPPGSEVSLSTNYGALLFAWSDGPVEFDGVGHDPFGF